MGKFTEYAIPLKSLQKGEHVFTFHLGKRFFDDMESADIRDANVEAVVTVNYANDAYAINFDVKGEVTVQCDRCLEEMQWPVEATYHITVQYGDAYRDDSDELLEIPSSVNDLNVAYMLYDTVSLAVPMKHVHPMGKCNRQMSAMLRKHRAQSADDPDAELENTLLESLDSDSGVPANAPVDPRWEALRDIAADTETGTGDSGDDD